MKGAGPARWQRYGERVVAITGSAQPQAQPLPPPQEAPPPVVRERIAHYGDPVWNLYAKGANLQEICNQLKKPAAEVASQLADAARQGRALDVARLLGAERVEAIRSAAKGGDGDLVAVRKRLPFPAALAEIRLALI